VTEAAFVGVAVAEVDAFVLPVFAALALAAAALAVAAFAAVTLPLTRRALSG